MSSGFDRIAWFLRHACKVVEAVTRRVAFHRFMTTKTYVQRHRWGSKDDRGKAAHDDLVHSLLIEDAADRDESQGVHHLNHVSESLRSRQS